MRGKKKEIRIQGVAISEGIAMGIPYFLQNAEEAIPDFPIPLGEVDHEIDRYRRALFSSREDLEQLHSDLAGEGSRDAAGIIDTHIQMLDDPLITTHMEEKIRQMKQNTEAVFRSVIREFETRFSKVNDSFFQQRFIDVMDVSKRILGHLGGRQKVSLSALPSCAVIFAEELTPSQAAAVPSSRVGGFVTERGGENSHAALIARAKGIPHVAAVGIESLQAIPCDLVIVDGLLGEVIMNPTLATIESYKKLISSFKARFDQVGRDVSLKAETSEGVPIRLRANIGALTELEMLAQQGAEGIGLFRTEYLLFAGASLPSEEEQAVLYRQVISQVKGFPFVVRVFDIGGDKVPPFFSHLTKEGNPVLGCRGIRFLLQNIEFFRSQLRALFRSAGESDMRLLLPLVSDITELRAAQALILEVKRELGIHRHIPVGCMIEVPSAVMMGDVLARECDFLSIGTNDLVQYTLGIDRNNSSLNSLYYPAHPSVIRLIKMVIEQGRAEEKQVCVCGEMASSPLFLPLLIGLGIRELSCAIPALPFIKRTLSSLNIASCEALAAQALGCETVEEVNLLLESDQKGRDIPVGIPLSGRF